MKEGAHDYGHGRSSALVAVSGRLPSVDAKNLSRISVYLMRGGAIIGESPLSAGGAFQFHVTEQIASDASVHVVLGPKGLDPQSLATRSGLPRISLSTGHRHQGGGIHIDFAIHNINELIEPWWIWCREYTVSGTLTTTGECPIPAQVTVYNVTSGVSGLIKTDLKTVPTDANGNFTATFNWCSSRFCWWPCWPSWWYCWPWWWELDILAVLEHLEQRVPKLVNPGGPVEAMSARIAPLRQPATADLMTGVGFAALRQGAVIEPDKTRTALIASKLANPAIREIFPWWWWCCQNPNIVFSATQGATTVLDEDPTTSTRWCFPSGQSVLLTGNSESLGACPVTTGGECAFAWTSVGGEPPLAVLVSDITMGYADGSPGGACRNLAFAGSLNLNGVFGGDCVTYYQVLAGQWGGGSGSLATEGNPARGGADPVSYSPLSEALVNYVTIWRNGAGPAQYAVGLGPFSYNEVSNLYVTLAHRQNTAVPLPPAVLSAIGAFPALGPLDFVIGWAYPDLVLTVPATDLVSPAPTGGTNLTIAAYDIDANPVIVPDMGPDLTLTIDNSSLTTATIDWVKVYNSDGTEAMQTAESSTECPAYQITTAGGGYALVHVTVVDDAAHLCEYYIRTQYGSSSYLSAQPSDRDYAQSTASFTPPSPPAQRYGVDAGYATPNNSPATLPAATNWTYTGGGDTLYIPITKSCCYDFQLWVSKRTTNGQTTACGGWNPAFQTVNIAVA